MKRSSFLKKVGGAASLVLFPSLYAWQIEPFWLEFTKHKMSLPNLPKKLEGKILMQISDIHVGNRFDWNFIIESFKRAQKLNPDFVVYTGDFVSYENKEQLNQLTKVMRFAVKGKMGTVAILGNHDYGEEWSQNTVANQITKILKEANIHVLRNQIKELNGLSFIGFDDYWSPNFDPEKAMRFYDQNKATIALCHNPDVCDLNIWGAYKGWILAGHTHGGQCKPPFLAPPLLPVENKRYTAGIISLDKYKTLYINRALGHLWQVRFNVRPEITLFELQKV